MKVLLRTSRDAFTCFVFFRSFETSEVIKTLIAPMTAIFLASYPHFGVVRDHECHESRVCLGVGLVIWFIGRAGRGDRHEVGMFGPPAFTCEHRLRDGGRDLGGLPVRVREGLDAVEGDLFREFRAIEPCEELSPRTPVLTRQSQGEPEPGIAQDFSAIASTSPLLILLNSMAFSKMRSSALPDLPPNATRSAGSKRSAPFSSQIVAAAMKARTLAEPSFAALMRASSALRVRARHHLHADRAAPLGDFDLLGREI